MKTVIVGGVAGGATAAARLRRLDETAQIVLFEKTGFVSYANCGLPYYIGGVISRESDLSLQTPESLWARYRIDVRIRHEVTAIHRDRKTVSVRRLDDGKNYEESYDKLLLAPGAAPVVPPFPGVESPRVFTLRTVEDTLRIRTALLEKGWSSAVIVGGGFIGMEIAENLKRAGLDVSVVEKLNQVLGHLDADMASFVHAHLRQNGVRLLLGQGVAAFEENEGGLTVCLEDGRRLQTDMALLAIGVAPDSRLAREAGLELGLRGSIAVDETMRTSDPDIYAAGDAAEIRHLVTEQKTTVALAGPANKQARVAADNMAGLSAVYQGTNASSILKVFDITVASTGIGERTAKALGLACDKVLLSPLSHAGYYPGGQSMTIKLLFSPESHAVLGAQIVGRDGVDKRIDVIATAMQAGLKVTELKDLDLAYAPPYSSAKDPVNMAGFAAENLLTGKVKQFDYETLLRLPRDGSIQMLDTRTRAEYARGHAEGFEKLIPLDELRERLDELEQDKPVYVMCQSGLRSYLACRILIQAGFDCFNFAGGYLYYSTVKSDGQA